MSFLHQQHFIIKFYNKILLDVRNLHWQLVPIPVLLSTLIRSRFPAKPATLLIPIDFSFPFLRWRSFTVLGTKVAPLLNVGSGFHCLRWFSILFFSSIHLYHTFYTLVSIPSHLYSYELARTYRSMHYFPKPWEPWIGKGVAGSAQRELGSWHFTTGMHPP